MYRSKFLILFLITFSWSAFSTDKIELASNGDTYLYNVVQEVGEIAYGKLGIKFSQKIFPHARGLIVANNGDVDGDAARVYKLHEVTKNKYSNLIRVNEAFLRTHWSAYVQGKNKDAKIENWESLKNFRVAAIIGNKTMEKRVKQYIQEKNRVVVDSYEQAFKMLKSDRIDVVVGKPSVGIPYLKKDKDLHMKGEFEYHDLYMYLHKKHKDLIPKLEAELKKLRDDGTLKRIDEKVLSDLMK